MDRRPLRIVESGLAPILRLLVRAFPGGVGDNGLFALRAGDLEPGNGPGGTGICILRAQGDDIFAGDKFGRHVGLMTDLPVVGGQDGRAVDENIHAIIGRGDDLGLGRFIRERETFPQVADFRAVGFLEPNPFRDLRAEIGGTGEQDDERKETWHHVSISFFHPGTARADDSAARPRVESGAGSLFSESGVKRDVAFRDCSRRRGCRRSVNGSLRRRTDVAAEFPVVPDALHGNFFHPAHAFDVHVHLHLVGCDLLPLQHAHAGDLRDI